MVDLTGAARSSSAQTTATRASCSPRSRAGSFKLTELRDFLHITARNDAACGVFTTLQPVGSANARAEIASKDDFTVSGQRFPRAQLRSISDHFDNRLPTLPMLADPHTGKPMQQTLPH